MDPLVARILADPSDLAARMVYGDALVELGDPRGELVASQCALASAGVEHVEDLVDLDVEPNELARLAGIQRRVQQLEAQHGRTWLQPLELPGNVRARFQRGMPESIAIGKNVEAAPVLERLAKQTPIGELVVQRGANLDGLELLAISWAGLRVLDVVGVKVSWELLETIAKSAPLRRLRLKWAGLDPDMIDRLLQLPAMRELHRLEISGTWNLPIEAIVRLARAHPDLVLALRDCRLGDQQVLALVRGAPQLRGLDVRGNPVSVAVLRELVALPRLRYLGFDPGRNVKHDKGMIGRIVAKATAPLRSLALGGSVNGPGLAAIAAVPGLADGVRAINLENDRPGRIEARGNAALEAMRGLVMLEVRWESIDVGFALMKLPTLAHFDCGHIGKRSDQKRLAAHYGTSVPAYEESVPTYERGAAERRIEVPDEPGLAGHEITATLKAISGITVELDVIGWTVRDSKVIADPIGITLKKYPNKPRYLTLWYWPDDAQALASRLDELAAALALASGGTDVDGPSKPKPKAKPKAKAKAKPTKTTKRTAGKAKTKTKPRGR